MNKQLQYKAQACAVCYSLFSEVPARDTLGHITAHRSGRSS